MPQVKDTQPRAPADGPGDALGASPGEGGSGSAAGTAASAGGRALDSGKARPRRRLQAGGLLWPVAALALLLIFNLLFTGGFFNVYLKDGHFFGTPIFIVQRAAPLVILAMGMALVIGTGGVDLSVGSVVAVVGAVAAGLVARPQGQPLASDAVVALAVALALAMALLAGAWNGLLVALLDLQPIVATLILMVAGRGLALWLTGGKSVPFKNESLASLGGGFLFGLPFPVTLAAAWVVLSGLLARRTALGLFIEAVGNNPTASHYAGVNAKLVKGVAYAFSGLCAGVAGVIVVSAETSADPSNAGQYFELDAILAVALGGTALTGGRFSLAGAAVGALLIQTLTTTILARGVPQETTLIVKALVVVGVCLLQSEIFRAKVLRLAGRRGA